MFSKKRAGKGGKFCVYIDCIHKIGCLDRRN